VTPAPTPAPGTIAPRPETAYPGSANAGNYQTPPPVAPTQAGRSPLPLIIGAVAVLALIIGIGGGAFVIGSRNQEATNEGLTKVAVIALSATKTFTATSTATPLPTDTPTFTATLPPTNTPTPNLTETSVVARLTALAQLEANFTQTALAQLQATQTMQANLAASQIALIAQQTDSANKTATASAQPTKTRTPVPPTRTVAPTRTQPAQNTPAAGSSPTRTPINSSNPYESGTPEEVVKRLQSAGYVTDAAGVSWADPTDLDINKVDKPNYYRWKTLGAGKIKNFVAAAKFTWNSLADTSGCGLMGRYSQPTSSTYRFHIFKIAAGKTYTILTYADTTDKVVKSGSIPVLNTRDGDVNHIIIIGQGSEFQLIVNGRFITKVTLSDFDDGNVAVASISGDEEGIECSFTDAWAYELTSKGSGNIVTDDSSPEGIIKGLVDANEINDGSAKLADQQAAYTLTSQASETDVFYRQALGDSTYRSFVFSTNITWGTTRADTTSCGVHFYGTKGPDNLIAFFMYPDGSYNVFSFLSGKWSSTPMTKGTSAVIRKNKGDSNRVTVIASSGTATIYVNGQKVTRVTGITISRGNVGYYLGKGKQGGAETCGFSDSYVWNLSQ
jgi:hypothetical protein